MKLKCTVWSGWGIIAIALANANLFACLLWVGATLAMSAICSE